MSDTKNDTLNDVARTWVCGECGKRAEVIGPSQALPVGWTWQPYLSDALSALQPGRVDLALGCCAEHALMAARDHGLPVNATPIPEEVERRGRLRSAMVVDGSALKE